MEYDGRVSIFTSQANVKRAIIAALNLCVPKKYRRVDGGIGALHYKGNQCPKTILDHLRNLYGRPTPMEKTMNEANWAAAYNPNEPIEDLYDRLKECFVVALVAKPAYTMDQMVDKALIDFQLTGLYATAILEWNAVDVMNHLARIQDALHRGVRPPHTLPSDTNRPFMMAASPFSRRRPT